MTGTSRFWRLAIRVWPVGITTILPWRNADCQTPVAKTVVLLILALLPACNFGRVSQGRVIAYDAEKGLITIIPEAFSTKPGPPRYLLPPVTFRIPREPKEMGPAPQAGKLLLVDAQDGSVLVFDELSGSVRRIAVSALEQQREVPANDSRVAKVNFPVVDQGNARITLYSMAERKLHTFRVAPEHLALPPDTWKMGDEVRYYYKDPEQALRVMNISKTDFTKGEH